MSLGSLAVLFVVLTQWAHSLYGDAHSIAGRYDFSTYYAAAYALRHILHANIYSQTVLGQAGAAGHVLVQPPLAYTYPPLFALLLSPFTLLSFPVLCRLWLVGNAALWLAITLVLAREIALLLRPARGQVREHSPHDGGPGASRRAVDSGHMELRPQSPPAEARSGAARGQSREAAPSARLLNLFDNPLPLFSLAVAVWLSLTFAPASQTLLTGQINFLVLAPLVLVPLLLRGGHDWWAGVAIAVAAILKFTPALLIVYLLLRRRWQAAAAAVIALSCLFALSALVVGPGVAAASITQALHVGAGDATLGHNQALFAPLLLFVGQHAPAQLALATRLTRLALFVLAVALGYTIWRLQPNADCGPAGTLRFTTADAATYGLALCGLLLLTPTAWVHHYVWLLPAAAIALGLAMARLLGALGACRLPGIIVSLGLTALACAALGISLPYDWDTNPHPGIMHAGVLTWPLALLLRPGATLALVCLLVFLGRAQADAALLSNSAATTHHLPVAPHV